MNIIFHGLIIHNVIVYLNDVILYSKNKSNHIKHITQIFERCQKYGISLNPKKIIFKVTKGKSSGHIISKVCITVDPEHIKVIAQLLFPHNKKAM